MSAFDLSVNMGANGRRVRESLSSKNQRSQELTSRSGELMNMGSAASLEMPFPVLIEKSEGAYLWDVDGNKYIDYQVGFGAMILGHKHLAVETAIEEQVRERGWHFGLHNPNQVPMATQIIKADNCVERVIFCNTGTEATMYAIRAARAFTGKSKIAVFEGSYHGAHDYGISRSDTKSPPDAPIFRSLGAGVLPAVEDTQIMLPYRSKSAFDIIARNKDELAVVLVECAQSSNPQMNQDIHDFLHELKEACTANGVLLMTDEVITGFRFAYGGAQEYYNLKPDLAAYGKIIGGGLPAGAVGGREDIMQVFNSMAYGDSKGIMSGGTFSGNPLTMAAGLAQLRFLDEHRDEVYPHINRQSARLRDEINTHANAENMAVQVLNAGSMFQIYFTDKPILTSRDLNLSRPEAETEFYLHLLDNGVLVPGTRRSNVAFAHSISDIDETIRRVKHCLNLVREDGLI